MDKNVAYQIAHFVTATTLIPLVIGVIRFRRNSFALRLLLILTGVSFIFDIIAYILIDARINPNYAGNAYTLIEFVLLLMVYSKAFDSKGLSKVFFSLAIFQITIFFFNFFFLQQEKIHSYTDSFSAFVFIATSIYFFYRLMRDLPALKIQSLPMFWINTGVLIYFAGNLFVFILTHYLVTVLNNDLIIYWTFHNMLSITKNILFSIGLWKARQTSLLP